MRLGDAQKRGEVKICTRNVMSEYMILCLCCFVIFCFVSFLYFFIVARSVYVCVLYSFFFKYKITSRALEL